MQQQQQQQSCMPPCLLHAAHPSVAPTLKHPALLRAVCRTASSDLQQLLQRACTGLAELKPAAMLLVLRQLRHPLLERCCYILLTIIALHNITDILQRWPKEAVAHCLALIGTC